MQSILEKACQTLAGENMASGSYKGSIGNQGVPDHMGGMKDFTSPLNFPCFQDLNIYGGDQLDHLQQNLDRPTLDGFLGNTSNEPLCLGKKRPSPYNNNTTTGSSKGPLIWSDDLRLQDLGTAAAAASCLGPQDDPFKGDHIQMAPPGSMERGSDIDSLSDIYETKPVVSGDSMGDKKFETAGSAKLERPSPRRAPLGTDRMSPMINAGAMPQGRSSPFG